jgi:NADH:ubiquinone oxidoreductase subunit 5 (subunit L)/multisubunit Na+/H+ antiporter MnhA subunit
MYLILPLLLTLIAAAISLLYGLARLNQQVPIQRVSWLLALAPLSAFGWLIMQLPQLSGGKALVQTISWMPSLGLNASLYFDSLAALFALLVTGIGTLVVIYTGYYFKGEPGAWRFLTYIFLFMTAMLGIVLAGDVVTLFVFWEGTSVTSFLLVAYKYKDEAARNGATKAFLITGGGGIALLVGLLLITNVTGSSEFSFILSSGEALRQSPLYMAILGLISFGAFTKSAQSPFHIWLPQAMSAPTPASAYLHSATMVKAGIYLLARLNPVLGLTAAWFYLLTLVGLITMLSGAYLGLKQNDLKALLAYSTITQLGVLVILLGQDTEIAFKALVIGILAHALYKSALFLSVGIIDHEAGTRDLRQLGGLWRAMPATFAIASLAAMSMAGLPPMFGFLAKETLLATVTHPDVPLLFDRLLTGSTVVAGALLLAQAFMLVVDTFLRKPRSFLSVHEAPVGMWLAPAIPALLSFFVSILPEPELLAVFLADAAAAAYGAKVKVSLAIWTGLSVPLLLSILAVGLGTFLFLYRNRLREMQSRLASTFTWNALYDGLLDLIDRGAYLATRTQTGRLRYYLAAILAATIALVFLFGGLPVVFRSPSALGLNLRSEIAILRIFSLLLSVAAAVATVVLRRDLYAILALGASGLSMALLMVLEPAPDVALVQIIVDILLVVILVLTLTRLPKSQRDKAWELTYRQSRPGLLRDGLIAAASGGILFLITLNALASRPRVSQVTPFYAENAKPLAGATDIVGAIVVDFRALDTLVEISVFAMAGLGVYTLIRYASRRAGDPEQPAPGPAGKELLSTGIGGGRASPLIRLAATFIMPVSMMLAATHLIYGHDQPGDGFTAGVIIGLSVGLWYVVFGYEETRQRLPWIKPMGLISLGLGLAFLNAFTPTLFGYPILAHFDYGKLIGLPLPRGLSLNTALFFEFAICLSVLGGVIAMLNALGHPRDGTSRLGPEQKEL